jgi:hypothetical protein
MKFFKTIENANKHVAKLEAEGKAEGDSVMIGSLYI